MTKLRNIVFLGLLALGSWLHAVETIIVGEIVNETTGEAIPNVNIHFRGTKIGTSSDANGAYALRVDMQAKAQLVFSAVGYYTQRFEIEPGSMAGLQVSMREKVATLTEVVIAPNENPALAILRQVREHRKENDRTLHADLTTDVQREQTLYVSHIGKRQLRRALWRSLQAGMIAQEDSTYILPLYRETQTYRLNGKEMTPANDQRTQALILTSTDYSALIGSEGNLNFYAPSVSLMKHAFLSPLAPSGNLYYRYYLTESETNDHTAERSNSANGLTAERSNSPKDGLTGEAGLVRIAFRTRNPFYATFNGEMVIDTTTFALRAINAYVPAEVAVNYVNTLHVSQSLLPDGSIADEHISALLDVNIKSEKAGTIFPTLLLNTSLSRDPRTTSLPSLHSLPSSTSSSSSSSSSSFSSSPSSPSSPSSSEVSADSAFAALDSLPIIRTAKWFATIATTGYIPTGSFLDIGHIEEILQVNHHEGVHLGLPFRTNEKMSKIVSLEASVGYGIKDRRAKGLGRISVNLPTLRRNILQLEYHDRYVWSEVDDFDRLMRENSMGWRNFDFTSYAFEALHRDKKCVNTAIRQRQLQFHWFADWTSFLETHAYVRIGNQPADISGQNSEFRGQISDINYQSLSLIARFSWGERKYDGYFLRRYAYSSKYPVLYVGLEGGHWSPTGTKSADLIAQRSNSANGLSAEGGLFTHLRLMLTQHANLGMGGTLTYVVQGGAIFGKVPPTLLWHANANQGYAYDPYRFTMLHGYELMSDKYVALHAEWNGQGILFNLIPGIRWLHLRELVEGKIAYGYLSEIHKSQITNVKSPHNFYAEVGVGLGNILRVCDLYSVWGYTKESRWQWAMRFRIHLGL